MAAWSSILRSASQNVWKSNRLLLKPLPKNNNQITRWMSEERKMVITPSNWQYYKFKDYLHYYVLLGVIPLGLLVASVNIFIGPATLEPIPEGYTPKHWEYHKHPISRFIARYIQPSPQFLYEANMHTYVEHAERQEMQKFLSGSTMLSSYRSNHVGTAYRDPFQARWLWRRRGYDMGQDPYTFSQYEFKE